MSPLEVSGKNRPLSELVPERTNLVHAQIREEILNFEDVPNQLRLLRLYRKSVFNVLKEFIFPIFFIIFHQSCEKLKKSFSYGHSFKLRMFYFHHFEHVGILRILQVLLDFIRFVYLKLLKFFEKLFVKFFR